MPLLRPLALVCLSLALAACQGGTATPRPSSTPILLGSLNATQAPTPEPTLTPTLVPTSTPDYSDVTITLLLFCAQDGPLASANAARAAAVEAAVAAVNAAGGIFGAQVTLAVTDTGDPETASEAAGNALAQHTDAPLAVVCDAASEGALRTTLAQHNLPAIVPGAFAQAGGTLYGLEPAPADMLAHFLDDLAANWAARKPAAAGDIRLALFAWPAELGGALPEEWEGVEVALRAELTPSLDLNVYDFVYEARDRGANVFYVNADSYGLAYVLNALSNLGLRNRVLVAAPGAAYDADMYSYLGDPSFAQGLYLTSARFGEAGEWEQTQMQAAVELGRQAIERALAQAGAGGLTRAGLANALGELGYRGRLRAPSELAVWQVGEAGELILVSELASAP